MDYIFKGTPGPWRVQTKDDNTHVGFLANGLPYNGIRDIKNGYFGGEGFSIVGILSPEDAHLMAAAPDMFEALKEIRIDLKLLKTNVMYAEQYNKMWDQYPALVEKWIAGIEMVLNKALNQQPLTCMTLLEKKDAEISILKAQLKESKEKVNRIAVEKYKLNAELNKLINKP